MKAFAKFLGVSLLVDAVPNMIQPRPWVNMWDRIYVDYFAGYFPKSYKKVMKEYKNLSTTFFFLWGLNELVIGLTLLALAHDKEKHARVE